MTAQGWRASVGATWLGHPKKRERMHNRVCGWLADRRQLNATQHNLLGPLVVDSAYLTMLDLGAQNQWLACTTLSAQLGELVLCALSGEILSIVKDKDWQRRVDEDAWRDVQAINAVRNVVCHPGSRCVPEVCAHINTYEREHSQLAALLASDWSQIGSRPFAEYALKKMNAAGEQMMQRYSI
jgi:hypothetical protein